MLSFAASSSEACTVEASRNRNCGRKPPPETPESDFLLVPTSCFGSGFPPCLEWVGNRQTRLADPAYSVVEEKIR